ncbi:hypothetical protein [Flammeovirga agarivorans]|uniref:Uncharacterized protein n=1 Tax=Flammeovirga agarivorans TaxID=2726742 RepID=A0A7X8SRE1_9BACT|nr:hypothetical protein [Flammeovirga agarivorans]NLR94899.1 hypothetical protein [Flammeovirga agarivorans]
MIGIKIKDKKLRRYGLCLEFELKGKGVILLKFPQKKTQFQYEIENVEGDLLIHPEQYTNYQEARMRIQELFIDSEVLTVVRF